jgi:hypothetical protein
MVEYVLTTTHAVSVSSLVGQALRNILSQALNGVTSHLQQVGPNARGFLDSVSGIPVGAIGIGLLVLLVGLVLTRHN